MSGSRRFGLNGIKDQVSTLTPGSGHRPVDMTSVALCRLHFSAVLKNADLVMQPAMPDGFLWRRQQPTRYERLHSLRPHGRAVAAQTGIAGGVGSISPRFMKQPEPLRPPRPARRHGTWEMTESLPRQRCDAPRADHCGLVFMRHLGARRRTYDELAVNRAMRGNGETVVCDNLGRCGPFK